MQMRSPCVCASPPLDSHVRATSLIRATRPCSLLSAPPTIRSYEFTSDVCHARVKIPRAARIRTISPAPQVPTSLRKRGHVTCRPRLHAHLTGNVAFVTRRVIAHRSLNRRNSSGCFTTPLGGSISPISRDCHHSQKSRSNSVGASLDLTSSTASSDLSFVSGAFLFFLLRGNTSSLCETIRC